jgi:hypothetical protein
MVLKFEIDIAHTHEKLKNSKAAGLWVAYLMIYASQPPPTEDWLPAMPLAADAMPISVFQSVASTVATSTGQQQYYTSYQSITSHNSGRRGAILSNGGACEQLQSIASSIQFLRANEPKERALAY